MNTLLQLVVIWLKVFLRELMNLQGDTQGHGGNSEILGFFGRKIPNAILPFSCIFNHNSPGAKYFEAKRVQAV